MSYRYVILGAGGEGAAAAYDLAQYGEAAEILLADADASKAKEAASRVLKLAKGKKAKVKASGFDPSKKTDVAKTVKGADAVLSTLEQDRSAALAQAAVAAKAHFSGLWADYDTTRGLLKLAAAAKKAGVSVVPGCGLSPGLVSVLAMTGMTVLDFAREAKVYVGALPQSPTGALDRLERRPEDLVFQCLEPGVVLRRGKIEEVEPLADREELEFAGVGSLEACVTGGSPSSCPYSFQSRLIGFECKQLGYPGHFAKLGALRDMGFLEPKALEIDGQKISPRRLFLTLAAKDSSASKDLVVARVLVRGKKNGRPVEIAYDLLEKSDPATGFTALERTNGFSAGAALWCQAKGKVKPGAEPAETALPYRDFLPEMRRRGLKIVESIRASAPAA